MGTVHSSKSNGAPRLRRLLRILSLAGSTKLCWLISRLSPKQMGPPNLGRQVSVSETGALQREPDRRCPPWSQVQQSQRRRTPLTILSDHISPSTPSSSL